MFPRRPIKPPTTDRIPSLLTRNAAQLMATSQQTSSYLKATMLLFNLQGTQARARTKTHKHIHTQTQVLLQTSILHVKMAAMVTISTTCFSTQKFHLLATHHIHVFLYGSQNKQPSLLCTKLTDWFNGGTNLCPLSDKPTSEQTAYTK